MTPQAVKSAPMPPSPWRNGVPQALRESVVRILRFLLPLALVVAGWAMLSASGLVRPIFLPSPLEVARQFMVLLEEGEILGPLWTSIYRAFAGLVLAVVVGVLAGLAMARSRLAYWGLDPLVALGFPAPKIAFMPIFILWFGIEDLSKILLVAFTCVFPLIVATWQGAIAVPRNFIWSARAMGTTEPQLLRKVIFPGTLVTIMSGIRVAVPVALITAFTAEMVAGGGGLGGQLMYAQRMLQTPTVFVYIVLMLLTGVVFDQVLLALRHRLVPWLAEDEL